MTRGRRMGTGRWIPKRPIRSLVIALAILLAVPPFPLPRAQQPPPPPQAPPPQAQQAAQASAAQGEEPTDAPPFKPEELEQIVAPIALYPDSLVAQTMMASTYPLDVIQAARLMKSKPDLKDQALNDELKKYNWDDSVKSLCSFPQVLQLMNEKIDWMQKLGDAFLGQRKDTMDAIQRLRAKAQAQGNLNSNEQQKVIVENAPPAPPPQSGQPAPAEQTQQTIIKIEPANPQVVYVPSYNPTVVYGTWPPAYPPYYPYPPGYFATSALMFGAGVAVGAALWGDCDWDGGHGDANVSINNSNNNYNNFSNRVNDGDTARNRTERNERNRAEARSGDRGGGRS